MPSAIGLMTCSFSRKVGLVCEMSSCSVFRRWFARGSTWSLKASSATDHTRPPTIAGATSRKGLTPLALSAVTSFSPARRLNAYSTATSTDIGTVSATVNGMESRKNSPITDQGSPLPTSSPNWREMNLSSMSDVSAVSANVSGPTCSLRTYLLRIFTSEPRERGARNFKIRTELSRASP